MLNREALYVNTVTPSDDRSLVPRGWVNTQLATKASTSTPLSSFAVPTANVSMNSKRITSLADPVDNGDAASRSWVLTQLSNLGIS